MRVHVLWWLALALTLGGCIETDRPIVTRETSEAPQVLTGLWSNILLVESDRRTLRLTTAEKGKIVYRMPLHVARLTDGFYVLQSPAGIGLVRVDGRDRLFEVGIAPGAAAAQIEALARNHNTKIELRTDAAVDPARSKVTIRSIAETDQKRLTQFLNDLIARKLLVSADQLAVRNTDPSALEAFRKDAARFHQERESRFLAALRNISSPAATRTAACSAMKLLAFEGHVDAMARWGQCLLYGWGDQNDPHLAFQVLEGSSAFGSELASYEIGKAYAEGSGGKTRDERRARTYLELAVTQGSLPAQALLAKSDGPSKSPAQAGAASGYDCSAGLAAPCSRWVYEQEKKGELVVAHIAQVADAATGFSTLAVRSDARGITVFYESLTGMSSCGKRCEIRVSFGSDNAVRPYAVLRVSETDDIFAVVDSNDFYRRLIDSDLTVVAPKDAKSKDDMDIFAVDKKLDRAKLSGRLSNR